MPRTIRPRVWMLLLAVAVLASAIEVSGFGPRMRGYRRSAGEAAVSVEGCRAVEKECREQAARLRDDAKRAEPGKSALLIRAAEASADVWRQLAAYYASSRAVYRDAAARPWAPPPQIAPFTSRPPVQVPR